MDFEYTSGYMKKKQYWTANLAIPIFLLSGCDQISAISAEASKAVDGINTNATNTVVVRDARRNAEALCINKVESLHPNRRDIRIKSREVTGNEKFDIVVEAYYNREEQDTVEKTGIRQSQSGVPIIKHSLRDDYYCVTDRAIINMEKFPEMLQK